jgi:hypothetical protein
VLQMQALVSLPPDYTLNRLTVIPRGSARSPDIPSELRFVRSLCLAVSPHSSRGRDVPLANPLSSGRRPVLLRLSVKRPPERLRPVKTQPPRGLTPEGDTPDAA